MGKHGRYCYVGNGTREMVDFVTHGDVFYFILFDYFVPLSIFLCHFYRPSR